MKGYPMISARNILLICSTLLLYLGNVYTEVDHTTHTRHNQKIRLVLFDLDGVLLHSSRWKGFQHLFHNIGYFDMPAACSYIAQQHPKDALFKHMKQLPEEEDTSYTPCTAYDPHGDTLPRIMADWMAGRPGFESENILAYLHITIDHTPTYTATARNLLKQTASIIFDPDMRHDITTILPSGKNLFDTIMQQRRDCSIGVLSNYDSACFAKIRYKPEIRGIFDQIPQQNVCISADMHCIKPDPQIYVQACHICGCSASECLFIDDQKQNVLAAHRAGMNAVVFDPNNIDLTYREIYDHLGL